MYIPKPYFENIPLIGDLVLDYIFMENGYPILFTCYKDENLYLCLCRTIYEEQKWIISEITSDILERMLRNELSIHDALRNGFGKACVARWKKETPRETFEVMSSDRLKETDLPEKTVLLDDEGESQEYLEIVKNREQNIKEKNTKFFNLCETTNSVTNLSINFDFHNIETNFDKTIYLNKADVHVTKNLKKFFNIDKVEVDYAGNHLMNSVDEHNSGKFILFAA